MVSSAPSDRCGSGRIGDVDGRHPATAVDDQVDTTCAVPDENAYVEDLVRRAAPAVVRVLVEE
jgi:hypothetical protein